MRYFLSGRLSMKILFREENSSRSYSKRLIICKELSPCIRGYWVVKTFCPWGAVKWIDMHFSPLRRYDDIMNFDVENFLAIIWKRDYQLLQLTRVQKKINKLLFQFASVFSYISFKIQGCSTRIVSIKICPNFIMI